MKLFKCLLLLCALSFSSAFAQRQIVEAGYESLDARDNASCGNLAEVRGPNVLEIAIGDSRINSRIMDCHDLYHTFCWEDWGWCYGGNKYDSWFNGDYVCTRRYITPSYSLSYHHFIKWWLQIGVTLTFANYREEYADSQTGSNAFTAKSSSFSAVPNVRFNYFNRRYFGLYSAVGVGFNMLSEHNYHLTRNKGNKLERNTDFMAQATFIGVRFGAKVYGTAELGVGPKGIVNAGVGYRF